jgi:hypothetical protein
MNSIQKSDPGSHPKSTINLDLAWFFLIPLTIVNYVFAEKMQNLEILTPLVLSVATLKVIMIGSEFMELRRSATWMLWLMAIFFIGLNLSLILLLAR